MRHKLLAFLATLALVTTSMIALVLPASADTDGGAAYVALGDSFAAGTGVAPYADATCLRSQTSGYPTMLSKWRSFRGLSDVTCAGSTTADIATQLHYASIGPNTRSVTVTVGGNDVDWSQALIACVADPQGCSATFADVAARMPAVKSSMIGVVQAIAAKAPNAKIYVTGYPYLFGDFRGSCNVGTPDVQIVVDRTTARTVNAAVLGLNAAIATGVVKSGVRAATYVDVSFLSYSHGLCGSHADWINGVTFGPEGVLPTSLHPNKAGEQSYAARVHLVSLLKK